MPSPKDPDRCTLCNDFLPCRLPVGERASRCATCQRHSYFARHRECGVRTESLGDENRAMVEARIAEYAAKAEAKAPLFARSA